MPAPVLEIRPGLQQAQTITNRRTTMFKVKSAVIAIALAFAGTCAQTTAAPSDAGHRQAPGEPGKAHRAGRKVRRTDEERSGAPRKTRSQAAGRQGKSHGGRQGHEEGARSNSIAKQIATARQSTARSTTRRNRNKIPPGFRWALKTPTHGDPLIPPPLAGEVQGGGPRSVLIPIPTFCIKGEGGNFRNFQRSPCCHTLPSLSSLSRCACSERRAT